MTETKPFRDGTESVWAGEEHLFGEGAICVPVFNAVTFGYDDMNEWFDVALGKRKGHIYSRQTNPTVRPLEEKIRTLDGGEEAASFSTGMAAISNTLFALLDPGDRVVSIKDTYGGSSKMFIEFLPRLNVQVYLCDTGDVDAIEREIRKGCKLLYLESPTNPTLKVVDIQRLASVAHAYGAIVVADNTFATPINQRPISLGADLVVYSATKYLNGHSDVMGGLVVGKKLFVDRIFHYREITGAALHPQSAYMILRGMKTLELRMQRHNENGMRVGTHLASHSKVDQVFYPGLETHPTHATAKRQMRGFGGMLSFSLKGGFDKVVTVLESLRLAHKAASLGSVGTLVGPPRATSHVELTVKERADAGIPEGLIRYSAGIENAEDLVADLDQALARI